MSSVIFARQRFAEVLRVEIRGRETAQETRELAEQVFAERENHGPSSILDRIRAVPGLRVAVVTDDSGLHAAHEYIELLAIQRGVPYRAFTSEAGALAWLRMDRAE